MIPLENKNMESHSIDFGVFFQERTPIKSRYVSLSKLTNRKSHPASLEGLKDISKAITSSAIFFVLGTENFEELCRVS